MAVFKRRVEKEELQKEFLGEDKCYINEFDNIRVPEELFVK